MWPYPLFVHGPASVVIVATDLGLQHAERLAPLRGGKLVAGGNIEIDQQKHALWFAGYKALDHRLACPAGYVNSLAKPQYASDIPIETTF